MTLRTQPAPRTFTLRSLRNARSIAKKKYVRLRFNISRSGFAVFLLVTALFLSFILTTLLLSTGFKPRTEYPSYLQSFPEHKTDFNDPCAHARPRALLHFDPSTRVSSEFALDDAAHIDPLSLTRVFTTFFKEYLFQPNSDIVVNLGVDGRGRAIDIRDSLTHAQRALRDYFRDDTIKVRNYSLGYSHLDRVRGSRYVLHLISFNKTNPRRHDVVALQRTFDGNCYVSVREYEQNLFRDATYLVVPYSDRPARLQWFLNQFDRLRAAGVVLRLVLSICEEIERDIMFADRLVDSMKYSKDVQVVQVPGDLTGFFSRAIAVRDGASSVPRDSIMFITDIDMYIYPTMFDSCRLNCIQGSQVYFPVFYSLYARSTRIDKDAGYWRDSSFGMSCMYKSDFDAVGAYQQAEQAFVGWGGEDVVLSQTFSNDSRYEVFRAVEPALRHKWHVKKCEAMTPSYNDCVTVLFQQLGTMASVGKFLLEKDIDVQASFGEGVDEDAVRRDYSSTKDEALSGIGGLSRSEEEKRRLRQRFLWESQKLIQAEKRKNSKGDERRIDNDD